MKNRLEQFSMQDLNTNGRRNDDEELRIPMDLSAWVEAGSLNAWVMEEVDTLDWANAELQNYLRKHPDFQPKALLCLLVYAYATGTLESEEIVAALSTRPELRTLWRGPAPTTKEIGRFRKENRALLKWGIVQVLKRALQQKLQVGEMRLPAGLRQALVDSAIERLDLARHMDRAAQGA